MLLEKVLGIFPSLKKDQVRLYIMIKRRDVLNADIFSNTGKLNIIYEFHAIL